MVVSNFFIFHTVAIMALASSVTVSDLKLDCPMCAGVKLCDIKTIMPPQTGDYDFLAIGIFEAGCQLQLQQDAKATLSFKATMSSDSLCSTSRGILFDATKINEMVATPPGSKVYTNIETSKASTCTYVLNENEDGSLEGCKLGSATKTEYPLTVNGTSLLFGTLVEFHKGMYTILAGTSDCWASTPQLAFEITRTFIGSGVIDGVSAKHVSIVGVASLVVIALATFSF